MGFIRVAVLALCARGSGAVEGTLDDPKPCCFTLGFASNQVPCCLETQTNRTVTFTKKDCTLKAKVGETLGFDATFCPTSADEAQCMIQAGPIAPAGMQNLKIGPECSFLNDLIGEEGEQGEGIPPQDPPIAPVKGEAKPKTLQPLINSEALRLRPHKLQPH